MLRTKSLSVITVTYNASKTLPTTIDSVKRQTYSNIQHVIVDGNSTDGTLDLIREYANAKIRWISEPDKGLYFAMNKAASIATGDYLCFLNAGDSFHSSDTVEKMMNSFNGVLRPDIIYGETAIVDTDGSFMHMRRLKAPRELNWKSFKQGMLVCHQAFVVKRDIFQPYDTSFRYSSDFDWAIRMMKSANCCFNSNLVLINYLNEGLTTANRNASLKERFTIMKNHYGLFSTIMHHVWFVIRAIIKK